jgi:hypothetical protein
MGVDHNVKKEIEYSYTPVRMTDIISRNDFLIRPND